MKQVCHFTQLLLQLLQASTFAKSEIKPLIILDLH
jgi:hypothetical protein